jgi:hypothetical protein
MLGVSTQLRDGGLEALWKSGSAMDLPGRFLGALS